MVPSNYITLEEKDAEKMQRLIDNLEDLDDVIEVYHNWEEQFDYYERKLRKEMEFLCIVFILILVILFLTVLAVAQIKMAGMNVTDFWSFIKANDTLDKLYTFSVKYDNLTPQQQIIFLKEAEKVFSAFDKVPDALWEEDYQKYSEILNKYKDIKLLRWEMK